MTQEQVEMIRWLCDKGDNVTVQLQFGADGWRTHVTPALSALVSEWEDRGRILEELRTESGRVAFALSNGWPLPEELLAARREADRLRREVDHLRAKLGE